MKGKESKKRQISSSLENALTIVFVVVFVLTIVMFVLYHFTSYKPLLLIATIGILPVLVNLVLLLPKGNKNNSSENKDAEKASETVLIKEDESADNKVIDELSESQLKEAIKNRKKAEKSKRKGKTALLYSKYRIVLVSLLIVIISVVITIFHYMVFNTQGRNYRSLNIVPVFMAFYLLAFLILEKMCKHIAITAESRADLEDEDKYNLAIVRSIRSGLFVSVVSSIVLFIESFLRAFLNVNITRYINIALTVIYTYQVSFILLSLVIRLIRKEMSVTPEITIPLPGIGGKDLSVISYLEDNTGITMRSLWSIKLMRKILPVALMGIVVFVWAFSGIVMIEENQKGAHYRLGKLQEEILEPGIHFNLPWLIDAVDIYNVDDINKITIGYESEENADNMWTTGHQGEEYKLLLGNGNEVVSINLRLEYRIKDLKKYVMTSSSPEDILRANAYEVITSKIINTDIASLLASGRDELPGYLVDELRERVEKLNIGLEVVCVILESIHPPVEIAEIYQQIISAGIKADEIIISAKAKAEVLTTKAETRAGRTVAIEEALKFENIADAEEFATLFKAAVKCDGDFPDNYYKYQKYVDAVKSAYSSGKLIILGDGVDSNKIFIGGFVITPSDIDKDIH